MKNEESIIWEGDITPSETKETTSKDWRELKYKEALEQESVIEDLIGFKLPPLEGTERQIKFACQVRVSVVVDLIELVQERLNIVLPYYGYTTKKLLKYNVTNDTASDFKTHLLIELCSKLNKATFILRQYNNNNHNTSDFVSSFFKSEIKNVLESFKLSQVDSLDMF